MISQLIANTAPNFQSKAVMPNGEIADFDLFDYLDERIGVVFFYPLAFTFVCPSEIIAFDRRMSQFDERHVRVVGVSVDSHFVQMAWRNTPIERGGIGPVRFPLVSDLSKTIAHDYGVLINNSVALRGSFLIDQSKKIRHLVVNDLPLGRNMDDMLRMVDALTHHQAHGEVCPAGWRKNDPSMVPTSEGVADYLKHYAATL